MSQAAVILISLLVPAGVSGQVTVIAETNVVDVRTGVTRPAVTVVVSGDRIVTVGPSEDVVTPDGATVVDGRGKYLVPGLWDMHVHTSMDRITREVLFPVLVAHGITGIRSMAADCFEFSEPSCGDPLLPEPLPSIHDVRVWRREMQAGTLVGPRIVAGSYNLHGPGPGESSTPENPGTPEDARAHVRLLKKRGVDFIKVYSEFPRDAYFALADEARRIGLPLVGHVPMMVRAREASDAGQVGIEHIGPGFELEGCSSREEELRPRLLEELTKDDGFILPVLSEIAATYDEERCASVFARFVENGTWVTPTLVVMRLPQEIEVPWRDDPRRRFLSQDDFEYWEEWGSIYTALLGTPRDQAEYIGWIRSVFRAMHEAGVRFLAGTDAGYPGIYWGSTLHEELRLMVSAGMTEAEALQTATWGPAEFLGMGDEMGSVEEGKRADLVLLGANPLDDISNTERIEAVLSRGRLFDRGRLDRMLAAAADAAAAN